MTRISSAALLVATAMTAGAPLASAAVVTDSYTLTPTSGAVYQPGQTGALSISFDNADLAGGQGFLTQGLGLTALTVSYLSFSATLANDPNETAALTVTGGAPQFLSFDPVFNGTTYDIVATISGGQVTDFSVQTPAGLNILTGGFTETVPEPATLAVLGAGLLGLGLIRRRA